MIRTAKIFLVSFSVLLLSAIAFAQGGAATGDLHITVKDPSGNNVTNATVAVQDVAKGLERTATSDGQGGYNARLLPPGTYTVTVTTTGFTKVESSGVSVTVGGLVELPITLTVAGGKEVIEVSSQAELVETSRSSTTDTIDQRRIDNLPINGRNYINFTQTDSQVVRDNAPNTGAAPTSGLNLSGQRARSNLVNVDGADATDNSVNGVRSTVSQEAVQEFQIITNGYAAEYGRASGGVVNIITRSGSNDFHGDVFGYLRNRNFQAVNPFSTVPDPAYTRVQAGAAFGGPIKKDKTYYFFSYEITRRHETGFSSIGQGNFGSDVHFDTTAFFGLPVGSVNLQLTPDQIGFLYQSRRPWQRERQVRPTQAKLASICPWRARLRAWHQRPVAHARCKPSPEDSPGVTGFPTIVRRPPWSNAGLVSDARSRKTGTSPCSKAPASTHFALITTSNNQPSPHSAANVSPSTVTGIEVNGQVQPFGQNAYSRTSAANLSRCRRNCAGHVDDRHNKVNEFRFQYARRGLSYFYNTEIPAGSDPAINITGIAYFGREPYSYIQRTEQRYQLTDNFSWAVGRHDTKFGVDFNYLPLDATFTVNYGGVYDFGTFQPQLGLTDLPIPDPPAELIPKFPDLSPVQSYGAGLPGSFVQGLGSPSDSFPTSPLGLSWQDSWRVRPNVTLNFGLRYDLEIPPKFKPPQGLASARLQSARIAEGHSDRQEQFPAAHGLCVRPQGRW